jgi:hypothetical protein
MTADTSLLAPIVIAAAVVIKTAIAELPRPGSTRREWAFATDSSAMAGGAAASAAIIWLGWSHADTVGGGLGLARRCAHRSPDPSPQAVPMILPSTAYARGAAR